MFHNILRGSLNIMIVTNLFVSTRLSALQQQNKLLEGPVVLLIKFPFVAKLRFRFKFAPFVEDSLNVKTNFTSMSSRLQVRSCIYRSCRFNLVTISLNLPINNLIFEGQIKTTSMTQRSPRRQLLFGANSTHVRR